MEYKIIKLKTGRFRLLERLSHTGEWLTPAESMNDFDTKEDARQWMWEYISRRS